MVSNLIIMKKQSPLYLLLVFLTAGYNAKSQHVSGAMRFINPVEQTDSNSVSISYDNLFYFRDYEYFHTIQTGYTLFGAWQYPRITIQPNQWLKIEAGTLLQKDFGNKQLDKVWPVFSLQMQRKRLRFLFGAIEGSQSHQLIEPLMSYDKVIERPIEEGFQFKYKSSKISADIWLDWELRQKGKDDFPEELTAGLAFSYTLTKPGNIWQVKIPVQLIAPHKGGQLDTNSSVVSTVLNKTIGLSVEWNNPQKEKWIKQLQGNFYYTGYKLLHDQKIYPYNAGNGILLDFFLQTKPDVSVHASYWKGSGYIAPRGGKLFQSISSIYRNENYKEPERQLLFLNLMYEKELLPGFFMDVRYSPYIDIANSFLEHSFLLLFSYRNSFRLLSIKKLRQ
jgi:hypothetical protein